MSDGKLRQLMMCENCFRSRIKARRSVANLAALFLLFTFFLSSTSLFSDTLYLRSGERIDGTIIGQDLNSVRIQSERGELYVLKSAILRITYNSEAQRKEAERKQQELRRQREERAREERAREERIRQEKARQEEERHRRAEEEKRKEQERIRQETLNSREEFASQEERIAQAREELRREEEAKRKEAETRELAELERQKLEEQKIAQEKEQETQQKQAPVDEKSAHGDSSSDENKTQPVAHGFFFRFAPGTGRYNPAGEKFVREERQGGALSFGGVGDVDPWKKKRLTGYELVAGYSTGRFYGALEFEKISIRPEFGGYLIVPSFTIGSVQANLSSIDRISGAMFERGSLLTRLAWAPGSSEHKNLYITASYRRWNLEGLFQRTAFTAIYASTIGNFALLDYSIAGNTSAQAGGPGIGLEYRRQLMSGSELRGLFEIFSLRGSFDDSSRTISAFPGGADFKYANKIGLYSASGFDFRFSYFRPVSERVKLFASLRYEKTVIATSQVLNHQLSTSASDNDPAAVARRYVLSYPGSKDFDEIYGVFFGLEARLF